MKNLNKSKLIPMCFLGLALFAIFSIYFDENYKKHDDEPVKNKMLNIQLGFSTSASVSTGTISPSEEIT